MDASDSSAFAPEADSAFIYPNELEWWRFVPSLLEHEGSFASVGTLRSFFSASVARPDRLILMDHSPIVFAFNARLIAMIRSSPNLKTFQRDFHGQNQDFRWIQDFLRQTKASNRSQQIKEGPDRLRTLLRGPSKTLRNFLFVFSEESFWHLKKLIHSNRVILRQMDVYYAKDWQRLREEYPNLRIDTIDLSNAVDPNFADREDLIFLGRELERMGTRRVHFTHYAVSFRQYGFSYHVLHLRDFQRAAESILGSEFLIDARVPYGEPPFRRLDSSYRGPLHSVHEQDWIKHFEKKQRASCEVALRTWMDRSPSNTGLFFPEVAR